MNTYGGLAQLGEHLVYTQVVGGSIPSSSITSGRSAAGSASGLGPEGRRFKSCHPDSRILVKGILFFIYTEYLPEKLFGQKMNIRIPPFLKKHSTIGIPAPSFGCTTEPYITRLGEAQKQFAAAGYTLKTGNCVYKSDGKGISTNPEDAAKELTDFYCSPETSALISAGGGELMCETAGFIDFDRIAKAPPKWFMGYSDNTNFIFPLVTKCRTAAIYGQNITGFGKPWEQSENDALALLEGTKTYVEGYDMFQLPEKGTEAKNENPLSKYVLTEKKVLKTFTPQSGTLKETKDSAEIQGILLGGCLDVLANLTGTKFDCMKEFNRDADKIIWILEACDLNPMDIRRSVWHLAQCGWFEKASGFIIGRPLAALGQTIMGVDQYNAVTDILSEFGVPVIADADIGHVSPSMPVIMGSAAHVTVRGNKIRIDMNGAF